MKKVLVYGFYKKEQGYNGNLGDQLFIEAFREIFPEIEFKFVDGITITNMQGIDAIFFGGGSFLNIKPNFSESILSDVDNKKVFYLGVGGETEIHPWHTKLLFNARLIACRSENYDHLTNLRKYNPKVMYCPDLVYGLYNKLKDIQLLPKNKSVLILPCAYLISKYNDPLWKHSSWEQFKVEFSQMVEYLIKNGYKINFFPLGQSEQVNDINAAIEIINKMTANKNYILNNPSINNFSKLITLFSSHQLVITQRFHGSILSHMAKTNCINIHHHDKMKAINIKNIENLSYYGLSKDSLIKAFNDLVVKNNVSDDQLSINMDIIKMMKERVINLL